MADPLEEPPDQRVRSHGFRPGPVKEAEGNRYPPPPASSTMASLPMSTAPAVGKLVDDRGVVIEDLAGIGLGAPGGGLPGVG